MCLQNPMCTKGDKFIEVKKKKIICQHETQWANVQISISTSKGTQSNLVETIKKFFLKNCSFGDFPDGSVAKNSSPNAGGLDSNPGQEIRSHTLQWRQGIAN